MFYELLESSLTLKEAAGHVVDKLNAWAIAAVKMLPNMVVAIIVLFILWLISIPSEKLVRRATLKFSRYSHIADLMGGLAKLAVLMLGFVLALSALNLDKAVASMLAGIGIIGVALGFAGKDLFADFISGIVLHFEHPFRIGDRVQTLQTSALPSGWKSKQIIGYIHSINWRATVMRGRQGERYTIPNKDLLSNPLVNFYISGERRIDFYFGIAYTPDLQETEDLALEAVRALDPPLRNPDRPVEFYYEEVNGTTIIFRIRFWTNDTDQVVFLKAKSEAIKAIDQTFKAHGIPFPSQNVSVDFGITGGPSLREQLEGVNLSLSLPEAQPAEREKDRAETDGNQVETKEKSAGKFE